MDGLVRGRYVWYNTWVSFHVCTCGFIVCMIALVYACVYCNLLYVQVYRGYMHVCMRAYVFVAGILCMCMLVVACASLCLYARVYNVYERVSSGQIL